MYPYSVGFDFGNSDTCVVLMGLDKDSRSLSIPSETSLGELKRLQSLGIKIKTTDYIYRDENTELFVGDLAISQGRDSFSARGDVSRYYSDTAIHLLLTTTAALTPYESEIAINMVTGVPVDTYIGNPEIRRTVRNTLSGSYNFSLNGVDRCTHIAVKSVVMEGAGAMVKYGLNGKVRQGVIDIGGKTTDLFVSNGQEPISSLCKSIPIGVENAYDQLNAQFESLYRRPLDRSELRDIMYAFINGKKPGPIYADGSLIPNVSDLARKATNKVGTEIAAYIAAYWRDNLAGKVASSFARVLLIGGGSYYYKAPIQRQIANVSLPDKPEMANAAGYCDVACAFTMKELEIGA
jgi:plasmid segregation protein ParM